MRCWLAVILAGMCTVAMLSLMVPSPASATADRSLNSVAEEVLPIERAERALREQLEATGIPGGAVAVVSGGRVDARGVGETGEGRALTASTQFVIGSASKSCTALAVMQLVDSGDIDLDAPVRRYVPELQLAPGERVEEITVRHLLHQTSGLDDLAGGPVLASAADGTPEQAIAELVGAELVAPPGQRWRYANVNYVLAGLVVERVSGIPYGDYVEARIFRPLQMTRSHAIVGSQHPAALSEGNRFWFGFPVATEPTRREATMAAGYLVSTAEDLGRYLSMYLSDGLASDGTRIVSADALDTLLDPAADAHLGAWADGQASQYAMGWFHGGPWGSAVAFHPGNTPDTSTLLLLAPGEGMAVAALVNAGNEIPVPGNPSITDRVTRNVAHAALDQPDVQLPSLQRFYLVFDLVVLVLLTAGLVGLVQAVRALRGPSPARHSGGRWVGIVAGGVTAAALVALPLLSYGWAGLWTWAPDVALALAALAAVLMLAALLRLLALLRSRGAAPAAHEPARQEPIPEVREVRA